MDIIGKCKGIILLSRYFEQKQQERGSEFIKLIFSEIDMLFQITRLSLSSKEIIKGSLKIHKAWDSTLRYKIISFEAFSNIQSKESPEEIFSGFSTIRGTVCTAVISYLEALNWIRKANGEIKLR